MHGAFHLANEHLHDLNDDSESKKTHKNLFGRMPDL